MATHALKLPLFLTRLSIFIFMLPWQITRFTSPEIINTISNKYYKFSMPPIGSIITGVFMMALILAFVAGFKKRIAIPTIGAMLLLYCLRDEDTMLSIDSRG